MAPYKSLEVEGNVSSVSIELPYSYTASKQQGQQWMLGLHEMMCRHMVKCQ